MARFPTQLVAGSAVLFFLLGCAYPTASSYAGPNQNESPQVDSASQGQPSMEIPDRIYDIGDVKGQRKVEHDFRVLNHGEGILLIKKIMPS